MQTLSQFQALIEQYIEDHPFADEPKGLYEPASYIISLGGKRLRPAFVLMGHYLFADDVQKSLPAAYAVEIFHNFSLVHDDIMDAAPLRRGKPTVHLKYGLNTGILSGDAMLIEAYEYLSQLPPETDLRAALKVFNRFAIEVCEGQQYDLEFETRSEVDIAAYLRMIELKTAALIGGSLHLGALTAGASRADCEHLDHFGRLVGTAFQLQDDILDAYGDPAKFGKKVGGDIVQNKKTYLFLRALELASSEQRTALEQWYSQPIADEKEKIQAVMNIFDGLNIRQAAISAKEQLMEQAYLHLDAIHAPAERRELLRSFTRQLADRDF